MAPGWQCRQIPPQLQTVPCGVVQLVMPMPIMIWLAVVVEAGIGNWVDMVILLLIQFINASIGWCVQLTAYQPHLLIIGCVR